MFAFRPAANETLQFEAPDPRADGCRRAVTMSRDLIVIARQRDGVAMRIALTPSRYRGVLLSLETDSGGVVYQVTLVHADPELSLALARSDDEAEAARAWRDFARFTGAPALVEREVGVFLEVRFGGPAAHSRERRRGRGVGARRPRFLARRKVGRAEAMVRVDRACVLFDGWRDER